MSDQGIHSLASYRRCVERISSAWPRFLDSRNDRLRHGNEAEKVAEGIIEDLFTEVLDWTKGDLLYQTGFADIVLSRNLCKYLVVEVKRPGLLAPGCKALDAAVGQARRYADQQKILRVGATDGRYFYAADLDPGGLKDRLFVDLASQAPPLELWWISEHGIYRPCDGSTFHKPTSASAEIPPSVDGAAELLHPKYKLPARCFAYVGNSNRPATWKLPYLLASGQIDTKRLPKAIQSLLSNYRGAKVAGIPEAAMPGVLLQLARAANTGGHLPPQATNPAPVYRQLAEVLAQQSLTVEARN